MGKEKVKLEIEVTVCLEVDADAEKIKPFIDADEYFHRVWVDEQNARNAADRFSDEREKLIEHFTPLMSTLIATNEEKVITNIWLCEEDE